MATSTEWQLAREAAERYENILVPAILGPAARTLVERARIEEGATVADVGCGTGAAARYAVRKVGDAGRVIGIDVNAGMIEVARSACARESDRLEWQVASASALPFPDATVDAVVCAQTLQFLRDRAAAAREMRRVLKPGGIAAVSVWTDVEESPYFHALVDAVASRIGAETAAGLGAAFGLSDAGTLRALLDGAGFDDVAISTETLDVELPPLREFVPRHVSATPMAPGFASAEPAVQKEVVERVIERLAPDRAGDTIRVPFTMRVAIAAR